jgi:hypothetical protein
MLWSRDAISFLPISLKDNYARNLVTMSDTHF